MLEGEEFKRLVDAHTVSNRRAQELAADRHDDTSVRSFEQRTADGLIALVHTLQAARAGGSGAARSAKPTVVVTMSLDALRAGVEQAGTLTGGQQVTAGELRRLACDARVIPVVLGSASQPIDVGREQRLVTPAIRTALEVRDQGCAFPGCTMPPSCCEAHHIIPWYLHGPTALDNLVLLCPHHHATVEPLRFFHGASPPARWQVHMGEDGHPVFTPPGRIGQPLPQTPLRNQRAPQPVSTRPEHPPPEQPLLE